MSVVAAAYASLIASSGCTAHPPSPNAVPSAPPSEIAAREAAPREAAPSEMEKDAGAPMAPPATATPAPTASASAPHADANGGASAPSVRVINIGMHIGGGPNDDVTKEPIHKSVAPHFEEIARCFPANAAPPVEFGVDLTIEAKGGKAQVARPRTALRDDGFIACVVGVFEAAEFLPPRFGKTVVSYSLRFVPPKTH